MKLIWKLAKNDFKKRYAGSYMGAVWAMIQPVVTVCMYYVVFDLILKNDRGTGALPFVLFLTAGLVPWFYFSEALNGGTGALLDYNYLVKKVVFDIKILPVVKVLSACFIHAFFIIVMLVIAAVYGYFPSVYTIQLVYYSLCLMVFSLALSYTTSALVVFFRDLSQIINILLQIGMWATPILWDINSISPTWAAIVKINPVAYVVIGYRQTLEKTGWFFTDWKYTLYFWGVTVLLLLFGRHVFKKLRPQFADVL